MTLAAGIGSLMLAGILAFSAARKLSHEPAVVETYVRVGVPRERLDHLAYILVAGAVGLAAGILWNPIGIAAAVGVSVYFLLAIAAHIRADDTGSLPTPLAIELIAAGVLVLRIAAL